MMMAAESLVIHPVVVMKVNNMCQALLDTGAGSSYASAALLDRLKVKPVKKETKNIDMMMSSTTRKLEIYVVEISELSEKFKINSAIYNEIPGNEMDLNNLMLSRTSIDDCEKLCNLDALGVQDIPKTHEDMVIPSSKNN